MTTTQPRQAPKRDYLALSIIAAVYLCLQVGATAFPLLAGSPFTGGFTSAFGLRMVTVALGTTVWATGVAHLLSCASFRPATRVVETLIIVAAGAVLALLPVLSWVLQGPVHYC